LAGVEGPHPLESPAPPDAGTEPERVSSRRQGYADSPLEADERDRLVALRAATSDNAPLHVAVLTALAEAAAAYQLQLRTAEIRARLASTPHLGVGSDDGSLRSALDQLRDWGCVDWVQDPSIRASTIEQYVKRHELWEITPAGNAVLDAVAAVLGAAHESGSLQRTMFRQIRSSLEELVVAVASGDAEAVYLQLRELDLALAQLATNAREFYATINRIAREERLDDHVFLLYKDQLIAYLQSFHDDLLRNRVLIAERLVQVDREHRSELLSLAAVGDDSTGLFGDEGDWPRRWDGMLAWFVANGAEQPEIDALGGATTVAIRELLTLLRRLTEQATRPVNRAAELRETAAWFARCDSDDRAHELFDAAFGLSPLDHAGLAVPDPDADGRFPSWWEIAPVAVPLSLRIHGRRPARGGTAKRRDYSQARRAMELELAAETERRQRSEERLVSLDLSHDRVGIDEWPVLLRWLDEALARRDVGSGFVSTVRTSTSTFTLRSDEVDTRVVAPTGTLTLRRCRLEVSPS
jgi:uncharacterized protein (TIGR02677 family)